MICGSFLVCFSVINVSSLTCFVLVLSVTLVYLSQRLHRRYNSTDNGSLSAALKVWPIIFYSICCTSKWSTSREQNISMLYLFAASLRHLTDRIIHFLFIRFTCQTTADVRLNISVDITDLRELVVLRNSYPRLRTLTCVFCIIIL